MLTVRFARDDAGRFSRVAGGSGLRPAGRIIAPRRPHAASPGSSARHTPNLQDTDTDTDSSVASAVKDDCESRAPKAIRPATRAIPVDAMLRNRTRSSPAMRAVNDVGLQYVFS